MSHNKAPYLSIASWLEIPLSNSVKTFYGVYQNSNLNPNRSTPTTVLPRVPFRYKIQTHKLPQTRLHFAIRLLVQVETWNEKLATHQKCEPFENNYHSTRVFLNTHKIEQHTKT